MRGKCLATVALVMILLCGTAARADSTVHIGTACRAGCSANPNLIDRGAILDIVQVLGVGPHEVADGLALFAVRTDPKPLSVALNGVSATTEPGALVLLGAGLLSLGGILRRWVFSA